MKILKNILLSITILILGLGTVSANTISAGNYFQNVGDTFSVSFLADFNDGILDGGALTLKWDESIISFNSFIYDVAYDLPTQSNTTNSLQLDWANIISAGRAGQFSLGAASFTATNVGFSALTFENASSEVRADFIEGGVTVVPVPAAFWLFVTAFTGIGVIESKKSQKMFFRDFAIRVSKFCSL